MDTVLFFQHLNSTPAHQRLEGLATFAREVGWNIQCQDEPLTETDLREMIDFWKPIGTILSTNDGRTEYETHLFSPESTVLLDCYPAEMNHFAIVSADSTLAGELAVRELISTNCASYIFLPWFTPRLWSDSRKAQFYRLTQQFNLPAHEFVLPKQYTSNVDLEIKLADWLQTLPKPVGLFAANDIIGMHAISACRRANLSVPFDCVVVGIDDDETICCATTPTLSSVHLNFRDSAYRAGQILHQLINHELTEKPLVYVPPVGFSRRGSSRVFLQTDRAVLQASELILSKACNGLSARDVLSLFPCSRRLAEMRFRKATGHSIQEEIRTVRINHAKKLLSNPRCELAFVAEQCGYASDTTFRRIFHETTGMTMSEWRQQLYDKRSQQGTLFQ